MPNQSEECNYNPNLFWFKKTQKSISLCAIEKKSFYLFISSKYKSSKFFVSTKMNKSHLECSLQEGWEEEVGGILSKKRWGETSFEGKRRLEPSFWRFGSAIALAVEEIEVQRGSFNILNTIDKLLTFVKNFLC